MGGYGGGGGQDRESLTTSGPTDKATDRESLGLGVRPSLLDAYTPFCWFRLNISIYSRFRFDVQNIQ